MATRAQVVSTFATVLGINPLTVELILRYLSKAGLVPLGLPGRRSAHYRAEHLKNLILALAAHQPAEAVAAVQILNDLHCITNTLANLGTYNKFPSIEKGTLFGDWIVQEIEARVVRVEADYIDLEPKKPSFQVQREIRMSVNPPSASDWRPNDSNDILTASDWYHVESFRAKGSAAYGNPRPVLSRETNFTIELLIAAGELLADTLAKQATTPIPDPVPGRTGEGDATPETMKAAGPGSHDGLLDTPASRTRRQRPLNKAQPTASQGSKQLLLAVPTGHESDRVRDAGSPSPRISKGAPNGTAWTDAASPQGF